MILLVDIDAFFAQVEQLRYPALRGKPVIVGAGVIATSSYEARRRGLKTGMRLSEAKRICPEAVILEGCARTYRCFAESIFALCREVAPSVESYLDEAYLDLSGTERFHGHPLAAGARLKEQIRRVTGLTVSVGIGPNRMLAKMACKKRRPDGLNTLTQEEAPDYLFPRPVQDLPGVGHQTARKLLDLNIRTIGELRAVPVDALERLLGSPGRALHDRSLGLDSRVVTEREVPRTISRETSFHQPATDPDQIEGMLRYLCERAGRTLRELGVAARTVGASFSSTDDGGDSRVRTLRSPTDRDSEIFDTARELLRAMPTRRVALHRVGVSVTNIAPHVAEQGLLFDEAPLKESSLLKGMDAVRLQYGHSALVSGQALHLLGKLEQDEHGFVLRTPSLTK